MINVWTHANRVRAAVCLEMQKTFHLPETTIRILVRLTIGHLLYCAQLRPGVMMATETGGEEEIAASDSVAVQTSKPLTESHQPLVSSTD